MLNKNIILLAVILFVILPVTAKATVFQQMSYQGILMDDAGNRVDSIRHIWFKIYNQETGGSAIWSQKDTVDVDSGIVNVILGPMNLTGTEQYWLGIAVTTESDEMSPRIKLTAVPYSMNADRLDGNDASAFYTKAQADDYNQNNIDAKKLGGEYASYYDPENHNHDGRYLKRNVPDTSKGRYSDPLIRLENTGSGKGIEVEAAGIAGKFKGVIGVEAYVPSGTGGGIAVYGSALNASGTGVEGRSKGQNGVLGTTEASEYAGVRGESSVSGAAGVSGGNDNAGGYGVAGWSSAGKGVYGWSSTGDAVYCDGQLLVKGYSNFEKQVTINETGGGGQRGLNVTSQSGYGAVIQTNSANHDALMLLSAGMSSSNPALHVGGTSYFTGYAEFDGGHGDLAENYHSSEDLEPGDVVIIDEDYDLTLKRCGREYDPAVAGIVSSSPSQLLSGNIAKGVPLALAGRVLCKVVVSNGKINRGDLLTTSGIPGYAMKATDPKIGTIIGKALEPLESGQGKIQVLVMLR